MLGRRTIDLPSESGWDKVEQGVVDFEKLGDHSDSFGNVDSAFCCLGTTRGKAGKDGFIRLVNLEETICVPLLKISNRVDHDYVLESAKQLKAANCPDFHLLSSRGASTGSMLLYPATKGRVEESVRGLGFPRLTVYRPGLLLCDRAESRPGERLARWVASWFRQPTSWSVSTKMVAAAMVSTSLAPVSGSSAVLEHADIVRIALEASL